MLVECQVSGHSIAKAPVIISRASKFSIHSGKYIQSCSSCELIGDGSTLYCLCDATYSANRNYTSLNLGAFLFLFETELPYLLLPSFPLT